MIAVRTDGTAPAQGAVDCPRYADSQAAHAAREACACIGLDDQMQMVILHAEVHDPKPVVRGRGQRAADVRIHPRGAQATNGRPGAQGDVRGMSGMVRRARNMWHPAAVPWLTFPPGAGATSAPSAWSR